MTVVTQTNKRIAKNTLFMYMRMLLILMVSLYTSRIVLQTLGEQNFGIYNIVGGLVVLFTFINSAMSSGTQRHLSYEMGKLDGNVARIFSACLNIHATLALIIFFLSETIGLWFLNTQMNFPEERMYAVNWCYQLSILTCLLNIIRVPYNALIIANERMSFYAYMGIFEAALKLAIVYMLSLSPFDKLIIYSFLILFVTFLCNLIYVYYNKKYIINVKYEKVSDTKLYGRLLSFSGWALLGSIANVGIHQGINIIINIFFGVVLNAAVGIANQINSHIMNFVVGFQQALNPQLTKAEAQGDRDRQFFLICRSAKFSFMIMLFIAFPLLLNIDYVLHFWLGEYPEHTSSLCAAIITGALIESFSGPLWVTIFATGRIKVYQITVSLILLLNLPISYLGGKMGISPEMMFTIRNIIYVFAFVSRLIFLKRMINFDVLRFLKYAVLPMLIVGLLLFSCFAIPESVRTANTLSRFISILVISVLVESFVLWSIGMDKTERQYLKHFIFKIKNR